MMKMEDEEEIYTASQIVMEDVFEVEVTTEMSQDDVDHENSSPNLMGQLDPVINQLHPIIIVSSLMHPDDLIVQDAKFHIDVSKDFLIGRSPSADIDIRHQAISRNHCVISFINGKAQVKNLSSVGMSVNQRFMSNKNETSFLSSGDVIMLSEKVSPHFILKYYDNMSHISSTDAKIYNENLMILMRKRNIPLEDSDQNMCNAKKFKQNNNNICERKQKRQALHQEKLNLDASFSQRLSNARKSFDSQVKVMTLNHADQRISAEDMDKKIADLKRQFDVDKNLIEAEHAANLKMWEAKCLEMEENCGELKAENQKLREQQNELKARLKEAEELIKLGREELELAENSKQEALREKQEALKKCLENESMKNFLQESNDQLAAKFELEMKELYETKLELEKKIEAKVSEKNSESESIINQLNDELDSVRESLAIHETERRLLESEVQSKVSDFAEVLESEAQCTICSEMFVNAVTLLGCFHTFCEFCITEWKKQKQECPICRHKILKNQEKRNFLIDSWIRGFLDKMPAAMKSAREEVMKLRAQQTQIVPNRRASVAAPRAAVRSTVAPPAGPSGIVTAAAIPAAVDAIILAQAAMRQTAADVRRARRQARLAARNARNVRRDVVPLPGLLATSPLNVNAPEFLPSANTAANSSVLVVPHSVPVIVNPEPIYVGEPEPNPNRVVPSNRNPIVISDEE